MTGVDPHSAAYRVHAHAFNTLTTMLAADDRFTPLSVREAIAGAIVEAIEPIIRADERAAAAREPNAALDLELAAIIAKRNRFRIALERIVDAEPPAAVDKLARNALGWTRVPRSKEPKPAPELAADGTTPGQRAHRLWLETRWPDMSPETIARDWEIASDRAKAAWEAVATGADGTAVALRAMITRKQSAITEAGRERGLGPVWHEATFTAAEILAVIGDAPAPGEIPG